MSRRGLGHVFRPKYRDKRTGEKREQAVWWIQYRRGGKRIRESSGSERESDAWALLEKRIGALAMGKPVGPDLERTTFEDLAAMVRADYKRNQRRAIDTLERVLRRLERGFANTRAVELTPDRLDAYVAAQLDEGYAPATVNLDLAVLRRMLRLGKRAGKVGDVPHIPGLHVDNARKGFVSEEQFRALLRHLPVELAPAFAVAYATGWRVRSEVLTRQWRHVDLGAGWLRLEPGETKNGEGRMFPLTPDLRDALQRQRAYTDRVERERGAIVPWVFHRRGKPIVRFSESFRAAAKAAGVPWLIPHDFRRTAVRNLERAGVPRSVAKKLVGHKTDSIYERYAIVAEADLREGAAKLAGLGRSGQGRAKVAEGKSL